MRRLQAATRLIETRDFHEVGELWADVAARLSPRLSIRMISSATLGAALASASFAQQGAFGTADEAKAMLIKAVAAVELLLKVVVEF